MALEMRYLPEQRSRLSASLQRGEGTESHFVPPESEMCCGSSYLKSRHTIVSVFLNNMRPEMNLIHFNVT